MADIHIPSWISNARGVGSWSFLPSLETHQLYFPLGGPLWFITLIEFVAYLIIQGPLTIGLHCSELIVNLQRDEASWRRATSDMGASSSNNAVKAALTSLPNVGLLIAKTALRELKEFLRI